MTTKRLIETWMPIAALGEESVRERRSMTSLPPIYYLHVWWARRPLVASRAAVLASLLPADADHSKFLHVLGIHGDPVASRRRIDKARREGDRFEGQAYSYPRAFTYRPSPSEHAWIQGEVQRIGLVGPTILDPTAGGGSIPFEAVRLGFSGFANDLNPVAALILRATIELPLRYGMTLKSRFDELAAEFVRLREKRLSAFFPAEPDPDAYATNYLWSRTIRCPNCDGLIPLSPNWRLAPDGTGVRLRPDRAAGICRFEIVDGLSEQSPATVRDGDAECPYDSCGRIVDGDEVKRQAQAGKMGEQLYAVVYKRRVMKPTKGGKMRETWERGYRAPCSEDDVSQLVEAALVEKLPEWEALNIIPTEAIGGISNYDRGHKMYGMSRWSELFSRRQLLGHGTSVEILREMIEARRQAHTLDELTKAAICYLAFVVDKLTNWNARLASWNVNYERLRSVFDSHSFKMVWSFAEMPLLVNGVGYDWAIEQTSKCIAELVGLLLTTETGSDGSQNALLFAPRAGVPTVVITNQSAESLERLSDGSVDAVVMDPPYYDNVMYAELSDFFYVWLKRTAGLVYPEFFRRQLTDKENEAVTNLAKFRGRDRPNELADRDYQSRMAAIFAECRRVLKPDGIMSVMFTHKATGAWDALASGLLEAGFTITASWPVNTEFEASQHIRDKAAANSTIFLVCRPRTEHPAGETRYWEDVEPKVAAKVREKIGDFEKAGVRGVDLYLSCFGPALEVLAENWPLKRGQARTEAAKKGRRKAAAVAADPYAVMPEDALDAARREVKKWKLDKLLRSTRHADLDPLTEWFVLAWDAFKAPEFPYDEALRLARVVGLDLDGDVIGKLAEKKGGDVLLWDSSKRAAKGALGPPDGSRAIIDALHHAAHRARTTGYDAAHEQLKETKADQHPAFTAALTAVLEVLPVSSTFTKMADEKGPVSEAASDFDALEHLRRLAYKERVPEPEQLKLWTEGQA
jgi:adenine-specific DNA methylase